MRVERSKLARTPGGLALATIEFDKVSKVFDDGTQAVADLDLAIKDGELMVMVGPSGCGKTTALRMVAGLEEITDGELRIDDEVVNDLTPKERDIAMVFQNYALYPHMTVEENLAFGLKLRKLSKEEVKRRVKDAAKALEIEEFLERKPRALSGGQRQRVAMGRAIVREPHAFLMDEPLSNLDAKLRVQMRAEIHQLQRRLGVTTIYVTHDQVEAMTMGDRVAVMRNGRLQQVDTPQVLYDQPVNEFVAGFIGSPSINLVEADAGAKQRRPRCDLRRPPAGRRRPGREKPLRPRGLRRTEADPGHPARRPGGREPAAGYAGGPADQDRRHPDGAARCRGARPLRDLGGRSRLERDRGAWRRRRRAFRERR